MTHKLSVVQSPEVIPVAKFVQNNSWKSPLCATVERPDHFQCEDDYESFQCTHIHYWGIQGKAEQYRTAQDWYDQKVSLRFVESGKLGRIGQKLVQNQRRLLANPP